MIKQRPEALSGATLRIPTGTGTAYITVTSDGDGPFEVFVNIGRGGSDIQAAAEAIGRLCSLVLRLPDNLTPLERTEELISQLHGIGGFKELDGVRSMPDGVAKALRIYIGDDDGPTPRV